MKGHIDFTPHIVNTRQHTLYVETLGEQTSPACLLIPGAMQGTWGWSDFFCQKITSAGFYVIRFDLRDIGRSSATPAGQPYTLSGLAKDIISILDELKIPKAHMAGHSMGGHLCQQLALDAPDRVMTITPIGSGPLGGTAETEKPLTDEEQEILKKTWEVFLERKDSDDPEEQIQGFLKVYEYMSGKVPMDKEIARTYVKRMIAYSPKEYLKPGNPHENVMKDLGKKLNDRKGLLEKIKTPTLIVHGELDPIALPRFARSMADEIPGAKLEIIPGMGHMFLNRMLEDKITDLMITHMKKH